MKRRSPFFRMPRSSGMALAVLFAAAVWGRAAVDAVPEVGGRSETTNAAPVAAASTNAAARSDERTSGPVRLDHASFRLISERNIFNPNRSARSASGRGASEPRKVVRVQSVSLLGTMSSEKGDLAFFDGSGSEFKKVLKPDDSIAGFKVQQISFSQVHLVGDGKTLTLPVGGKLRRQDDGPWEVSASTESSSAEAAASSVAASASEGSSASDAGESDVLTRLRKKREQEMKNEKQ